MPPLAESVAALINQSRERWHRVGTRGIDGPAPCATEREGESAPPWHEAYDKKIAAFNAFHVLTTPTRLHTPLIKSASASSGDCAGTTAGRNPSGRRRGSAVVSPRRPRRAVR